MAGKSKNTGASTKNKKTNTKGKGQKKKQAEKEPTFKEEIILLVILAAALILELSNFGLCGVVGEKLSGLMFGLFGMLAYILPVLVFLGAAFLISNQYSKKAIQKTIYGTALTLMVNVLCQLLTSTDILNVSELYTNGKKGGGVIGGGLCCLLVKGFGVAGAYILVIAIGAIMIILLTEISFVDVLRDMGLAKQEEKKKSTAVRKPKELKRSSEDEKIQAKGKTENKLFRDMTVLPDKKQNISEKKPETKVIPEEEVHEIKMELPPDAYEVQDVFETAAVDDILVMDDVPMPAEEKKKRTRKSGKAAKEITQEATREIVQEMAEHANEQKADSAIPASGRIADNASPIKENKDDYQFPPVSLLKQGKGGQSSSMEASVRETAMKLKSTLENFGVNVTITNYSCGPAVTRYEMQPEQGVKVSKIVGLTDDIKLNLAAADIRIEAPIPGKAAIGIEVPNKENTIVSFRDLIDTENFRKFPSDLSFAVGKDIGGQVVVTDIAKMPHLLIAGATGSGKSVCINTLIMSILYKAHPDDVKLIMIDPKMVELNVYNGIPHLLIPVVTDPKKAAGALNWAVIEMTNRYQLFAEYNVRNLKGYNKKIEEVLATGEVNPENMPKKLPQIVVIVDELADLMMVAHGEVEDAIVRLSQLARAAGIHLVIATQRPSVDVITGLIKANVPSRIAFAVSSGVDSRTILDMVGAEKLLGKGDMLFYPTGYPKPVRVQGAFVSDDEVAGVVEFLKSQNGTATYDESMTSQVTSAVSSTQSGGSGGSGNDRDEYFVDAGRFIIDKDKASIGMLQRIYKIGFNRAARIMDQLADAGVVGPEEGTKPRKVLMSLEEFEQYVEEYV